MMTDMTGSWGHGQYIATLTTAIVRFFLEWNLLEKSWHEGGEQNIRGCWNPGMSDVEL